MEGPSAATLRVPDDTDDDLAAIDALLRAEDANTGTSQTSSILTPSTVPHNGSKPRRPLVLLAALVCSSGATAYTVPSGKSQSQRLLFVLPVAQWGILLVIGLILKRRSIGRLLMGWRATPDDVAGARGGAWASVRSSGDGDVKRASFLVGILGSFVAILGYYEARFLDAKVWQAYETLIAPFVIFLPQVTSLVPEQVSTPSLAIVATITSFLVLFSLVGKTLYGGGIFLVLVKCGADAVRWKYLKRGLDHENEVAFLFGAGFTSLITSVIMLLISLKFPEPFPGRVTHDVQRLVAYHLVYSPIATLVFLKALQSFSQLSTVSNTVFYRNLLLLFMSTRGPWGMPLSSHWVQVAFALACGSAALIYFNPECGFIAPEGRDETLFLFEDEDRRGSSAVGTDQRNRFPPTPSRSPSPHSTQRASCWNIKLPKTPTLHQYLSTIPVSRLFSLLPLVSVLLTIVLQAATKEAALTTIRSYMPPSLPLPTLIYSSHNKSTIKPKPDSVHLVFDYNGEDLKPFRTFVDSLRTNKFYESRKWRKVVVYNRSGNSSAYIEEMMNLRKGVDEVFPLPGIRSEGSAYLHHIIRHYNDTQTLVQGLAPPLPSGYSRTLAHHTFFLKPQLEWDWLAQPRIDAVMDDTGYVHFGPYVLNECGRDSRDGIERPMLKELVSAFTETICAPEPVLSGWNNQFAVSRERILDNSYSKYQYLSEILDAGDGHWAHGSGVTPGISAIEESLTRAWPAIFACTDSKIGAQCPDSRPLNPSRWKCQCLDTEES
ncbi:hypothetical protein T439DRAFT_383779 [Meredithblackwellia eburnea MCA 4105]